MSRVIDFHTHIYPEAIAGKAVEQISKFYGGFPMLHKEGTAAALVRRLDAGGIDAAVVHSAAMSAHQVGSINRFIAQTCAAYPGRLIGFATLYPGMEDAEGALEDALALGLRGVKIHSDMLRIPLTDPGMEPIYAACEGRCPILFHMGDRRYHYDNPRMIPDILKRHPDLQLICAHMGGYSEWEEAEECLVDTNVYVDTSSSFFELGADGMRKLVRRYGTDRVLYGSDFPMGDPCIERDLTGTLGLTEEELAAVRGGNAERLLGL